MSPVFKQELFHWLISIIISCATCSSSSQTDGPADEMTVRAKILELASRLSETRLEQLRATRQVEILNEQHDYSSRTSEQREREIERLQKQIAQAEPTPPQLHKMCPSQDFM